VWQLALLSSRTDAHAALTSVSTQLSEALLAEASMRQRLTETESALVAAEGRESTLRAAATAAIDAEAGRESAAQLRADGDAADAGGGAVSRLTEGLLLRQRDEIEALKRRLSTTAVAEQVSVAQSEADAESSSLAGARASGLQRELATIQTALRRCETERDTLREALAAFDAREATRARTADDELQRCAACPRPPCPRSCRTSHPRVCAPLACRRRSGRGLTGAGARGSRRSSSMCARGMRVSGCMRRHATSPN
jgi:hypothetical protein